MDSRLSARQAVFLGVFALSTLVLGVVGVFQVASNEGWLTPVVALASTRPSADGLRIGTRVRVLGIPVGRVTRIEPPALPGESVTVQFWIGREYRDLVRADARTRVVKDGLVGERFLEIEPGSAGSPPIEEGHVLASESATDWDDVASSLQRIVARIEEGEGFLGQAFSDRQTFPQIQRTTQRLAAVADSIEQGRGTLGKLVTRDDVHEEILSLVRRADDVLGVLDENYRSVRDETILRRWMTDRYQLLIRPDATTYRKVFTENDLFESGRSVLTETGAANLDQAATWIRECGDAEVLVAGFARDEPDGRLAELVTRSQAQAVEDYLRSHHGVHRTGWFSRRKMSAHGFGNLPAPDSSEQLASRRIEILAFVK